jgi:hypothetical protein
LTHTHSVEKEAGNRSTGNVSLHASTDSVTQLVQLVKKHQQTGTNIFIGEDAEYTDDLLRKCVAKKKKSDQEGTEFPKLRLPWLKRVFELEEGEQLQQPPQEDGEKKEEECEMEEKSENEGEEGEKKQQSHNEKFWRVLAQENLQKKENQQFLSDHCGSLGLYDTHRGITLSFTDCEGPDSTNWLRCNAAPDGLATDRLGKLLELKIRLSV